MLVFWLPIGIGQWEALARNQEGKDTCSGYLFSLLLSGKVTGDWLYPRSALAPPTFGRSHTVSSFIKLCTFVQSPFWVPPAFCQTYLSQSYACSLLGSLHASFFLSLSSDVTASGRPSLTTHHLTALPCGLPLVLHSLSQHIFSFLHYSAQNLMLFFVLLFSTCPFIWIVAGGLSITLYYVPNS